MERHGIRTVRGAAIHTAIEEAHEVLGTTWPDAERQRIVRIRPERITGRRLQHTRSETRG